MTVLHVAWSYLPEVQNDRATSSDSLSVREQDLIGGGRNSLEILCPLREPISLITVLVVLRDVFSFNQLCISTVTWKNSWQSTINRVSLNRARKLSQCQMCPQKGTH